MPEPDPHADALLAQAQAGNTASLTRLLEMLGPQVRARIAAKISPSMRTVVDEDDVMQVTYLEAVLRLDSFSDGGSRGFLAWLTRLAENNLIDAVRAMESSKRPDPRKRVEVRRPSYDESCDQLVNLLGATTSGPSVAFARGEAAKLLEEALGKLPPAYEQVIRLYDLQGRTPAEVAQELGKTHGAMYMLRARAHDRLREVLGSGGKFFTHHA